MSALLTNVNLSLIQGVWGITSIFLGAAILMCLVLTIRRIKRNSRALQREDQKAKFNNYLGERIKEGKENTAPLQFEGTCHIHDITAVFLHYFRTLKGKKLEFLQDLISGSDIEDRMIASSFEGTRGTRMQTVKTLSYLTSQSSLATIHGNLESEDKYIRLTAARCLVRRKGFFYIQSIIESCVDGFPGNHKLLADILSRFGSDAVSPLEAIIKTTSDETSLIGCIEALVIIMPPKSTLDFASLMGHKNPAIRSATVALSTVSAHSEEIDPLRLGLTDEDISVKIRSAKIACFLKRSDLISEFYALTDSPVMWLRYWSMRAIWASGKQGEQFVNSLKSANPMAAEVALEMESGYV